MSIASIVGYGDADASGREGRRRRAPAGRPAGRGPQGRAMTEPVPCSGSDRPGAGASGEGTGAVAQFALGLRWEDLPAPVQEQARRCLLDLCGAAVAGAVTPVAGIARRYAGALHGEGRATVIGAPRGSTTVGAALANGFAASALDIDDGYRPVKGHPGAVVFPAVLAAAEQAGRQRPGAPDGDGGGLRGGDARRADPPPALRLLPRDGSVGAAGAAAGRPPARL